MSHYVLQDENGCTIRYLNWQSGPLSAVWLPGARRIDFVANTKSLEDQKIPFEIIDTFEKSKLGNSRHEIRAPKSTRAMYLKEVESVEEVREDAPVTEDKDKPLPLFLKYSTAFHLAALGLIFILAWVGARFFNHAPKAVTVQVFSQQDLRRFESHSPVVNVSEHHISRRRVRQLPQHYTSRRMRRSRLRHSLYAGSRYGRGHRYGRAGTSLAYAGALGVVGGMGPQYHGSGGLNIHSHSNNPGIGYGGHALRGGFERGMLGKGLIATGIGDGSSLQGYGGRYRHGGLGGGAPGYGYGRMHMAGSSGAYFEPVEEDSLVEGGLDRDQINAVIQQNLGQVTYCYEAALQSHPRLAGRVAVHFVIGSRGWVTTARVANTSLRSPRVESCIVQKLRGWKFPRPTGNVSVRVTYPFVLKRLSQG